MSKIVVYRPVDGITLNTEIEYLLDEDDSVRMFDSAEQAKSWLFMQGVTDEELSVMTFLESCGTCKRCGSPLFPSLLKKDGYTYQCFTCDEDFYAFEQND